MAAFRLRLLAAAVLAAGLALPVAAQPAPDWTPYVDPALGFRAELPYGLFAPEETEAGLTLFEVGGAGQIDVFGGTNDEGLTPSRFADLLVSDPRVLDVTYRRLGNSWFVVSGLYAAADPADPPLIFYAKVMFSPDRAAFSAFEITYPSAERRRFDPIVTRLERGLRAPGR